tara:strand:+ start:785 stop:1129 length:345 start_codon:yes stop_codon:yes gene_type:complete
MPEYIYENPDTGEQVSVIQGVNDDHTFEKDGVKYDRVFLSPYAKVDSLSSIDPNSSTEFIEKTKSKNMSLGELWDTSAELSNKRSESGKDSVKQKYFENYSEKRRGLKHMKDKN